MRKRPVESWYFEYFVKELKNMHVRVTNKSFLKVYIRGKKR